MPLVDVTGVWELTGYEIYHDCGADPLRVQQPVAVTLVQSCAGDVTWVYPAPETLGIRDLSLDRQGAWLTMGFNRDMYGGTECYAGELEVSPNGDQIVGYFDWAWDIRGEYDPQFFCSDPNLLVCNGVGTWEFVR
jgi:hypothetical protein